MSAIPSHRKRELYDIILEILKNAKKGAKKTQLIYKTNLSGTQAKRYLPALKKAGFITEESSIWKTTEKGLHVMEFCKICHQLCEEVRFGKQRVTP